MNSFEGKVNTYDKLILSLVPEENRLIGNTLYETLLNVCCFIASLSDSKALNIARDIGGNNLLFLYNSLPLPKIANALDYFSFIFRFFFNTIVFKR